MSATLSDGTLIACALMATGIAVMTSVSTAAAAQGSGCTPAERRDALRAMQAQVLAVAPDDSIRSRRRSDRGNRSATGSCRTGTSCLHTQERFLSGMPARKTRGLSFCRYAPSPSSPPSEWLDFNGPDGPYRLNGWAYLVPYERGSRPPSRRCIADGEWYIHDAGWHLMNGSMLATPDATTEPPRPTLDVGIVVWHPQYWDLHVWMGEDGTPIVSFANPKATGAGLHLPDEVNYRLVNGRRQPVSPK